MKVHIPPTVFGPPDEPLLEQLARQARANDLSRRESDTNKKLNPLELLFKKIKAQQKQRGIKYQCMTKKQRMQYANECVLALSVEVGELASSWPFASWKTGDTDIENIEREIIDCVFFLVNISCCFDITPSDLVARFTTVLENNQHRIDEGIHKEVFI